VKLANKMDTNSEINALQIAFDQIVDDQTYKDGVKWGKPRSGHTEASIESHIQELENNLHVLSSNWQVSATEYWKLRILIHTHDTLKNQSIPGVPIHDSHSHATLARKFLARFLDDKDLLNMVQFHDELWALYRQFINRGEYNHSRLERLIRTIEDWRLFLLLCIIDNCTAGKNDDSIKWGLSEVGKYIDLNALDIKEEMITELFHQSRP